MKKRLLSILLIVVLLLTVLPLSVLGADETGATITLSRYNNLYVVINGTPYYANRSGLLQNMDGSTALFAPGEYKVYYGPGGLTWNMDKTVYSGTATVETGDTNVTVSLSSARFSTFGSGGGISAAQTAIATSIYYNTGSFDHIHIRVQGSYVIHVGTAAYTARVSNPKMVVRVNGTQVVSKTWSGTTSYEWTYRTNISRSSLIEVELTLDLTYTNGNGETVVMEDVTVTYNNRDHLYKFVEAIAICDAIQGLDFTVSVEDIEEVINYYTVTYEWKVYGPNGEYMDLPAGSPLAPAASAGHAEDDNYVYDTEYVTGTSFYDYENGLLYSFHGWDVYTHSNVYNVIPTARGNTALDDGDTNAANNPTVPITADTYIYGYWTVTELEPASAYIVINKTFAGDEDAIAAAQDLWFRVNTGYDGDGDGQSTVDVDYTQILAARQTAAGEYRLPVYQYDTPFRIVENNADVPGYTRTTTISVTGTNATGAAQGDGVTVTLTPEYEGTDVCLGTVTYTNTYTKKTGTPISRFPALTVMKSASDTGLRQDGVEFTLYSDAACTQAITTLTTADGGLAILDFAAIEGIAAGTYYLKETKALAGYIADPHAFTVTLTAGTPTEELIDGSFITVTEYTLSVSKDEACEAVINPTLNRLHVANDPILGGISLTKQVQGLAEADKSAMAAVVIVHGPIARNSAGEITDIGSTYELKLNADNGWTDSLSGLPLGEYLMHESLASVYGYTWTGVTYGNLSTTVYNGITSALFSITGETALDLSLTNAYEEWTVGDFYIKKIDDKGNALAGATFRLFRMEEGQLTALAEEDVTITATTGADGYAHFTGFTVPEGAQSVTYYLAETQAPDGFYLSDTLYKVELKAVDAGGKTGYEPKISVQDATGAWVEAPGFDKNADLLTVTNYPVTGSLTLVKSFADGFIPEGLTAVTLEVAGPGNYVNQVTLNAANNWSATLTGLNLGTYTVFETGADVAGHSLVTTYTVGQTSSTRDAVITLAETAPGMTLEGTEITASATVTNAYTRNEETYEIPTTLTIHKVDAKDNAPLAGAVFTLERLDTAGKVISSASFTSNSQGVVVFDLLTGFIVDGQSIAGTYLLKETSAPTGYAGSEITWTVTVTEDDGKLRVELNENKNLFENIWDWIVGNVAGSGEGWSWNNGILTVQNKKIIDEISVTKRWVASEGVILPEAVEAVLYRDGEAFETVTLSDANDWTYRWENLSGDYTWTVDEKEVPAGFEKTVTNEGYNFVITNTKIFKNIDISVEKVWKGTYVARPDFVEAVLYRDGKVFDTVTLNEANEWTHIWTGLTDEFTWTVDEKEVPKGYAKSVTNEGYDFTITNTCSDNPKTGDESHVLLWGILGMSAALAAAVLLFLPARKKEER